MNLQTGAFGDPTRTDTLILFWSKMEQLHYPGAGTTKKYLEEKLELERAMMQPVPNQPSASGTVPVGTPAVPPGGEQTQSSAIGG